MKLSFTTVLHFKYIYLHISTCIYVPISLKYIYEVYIYIYQHIKWCTVLPEGSISFIFQFLIMTQISELLCHPSSYTSEDFQNIYAYKSTVLVLKTETCATLLLTTYFPDGNIRQKQMYTLIVKVSNQKDSWNLTNKAFCDRVIWTFPVFKENYISMAQIYKMVWKKHYYS